MATDTRLQLSHRGYTNRDLPALLGARILNGLEGWRLPPVLWTGYRQPKATCHALPNVHRQSDGSRNCPKPPTRTNPGQGDGNYTGTRTDASETRPQALISLHWPLCHVHTEHYPDCQCAPKPTV